ncbi:MAG: ATP-dependent DNA helicase RecG [Prevotellaceae bacterium]|nr:ATP-dependent DNA helicase RecG [Prevotellaceae bacterium]
MYNLLDQHIQYLPSVGPSRALTLAAELDIRNVRDLLFYFPYRYIDRSTIYTVNQLREDMPYVQLRGRISDISELGVGRSRRLEANFADDTGIVRLVWFAGISYLKKTLRKEADYLLLGKPVLFNTAFSISHPELELITSESVQSEMLGLHPVYHTTEKMKRQNLTSRFIEKLVVEVFRQLGTQRVADTLSDELRLQYQLLPLHDALQRIHLPANMQEVPMAQYRHKFEELFFLQLGILSFARKREGKYRGFIFNKVGRLFHRFYNDILPFQLTDAQKRVMQEIRNDLVSGRQMNRLLQGDVGSGKTIVAIMTMLLAIDNGYQACLMAPTEILAEQHYVSVSRIMGQLGLHVELLTGIVKGKRREAILNALQGGEINVLVGTHALIEAPVRFRNLGCAVIDEQHRFGVEQRAKLWRKNTNPPHILVMTATPIPRTLAMTVYGDLDISIINQLPPGRKPIKTVHLYEERNESLVQLIRHEVNAGHQAYVVYPLIKESEKSDLRDLEQGFDTMCATFPDLRIGKLHGKMKDKDKNEIMQLFLSHQLDILVSTTVIEVGVDVPNASVMAIVNADRFGLAQLHQLRGRVGRGAEQSYCALMTGMKMSDNTRKRMEIMVSTTDGFVIAEEDLRLRGPGDIEGTQQSGLFLNLKVASLTRDSEIMESARQAASNLLDADPDRHLPQNQPIWTRLAQLRKTNVDWSAIS